MLNEITKGMSNAAEKINENFGKLLISMGDGENGKWIRIPIIRLQICLFIGAPLDINQSRGQIVGSSAGTWYYPHPFASVPHVFASVNNDNRWASTQPRVDYASFRQWGFTPNAVAIDTILIAIGPY